MSARQLSCRAPAKISLALAVCSLTMMVSGTCVSGGPTARTALSSLRAPVSVTTTVAFPAPARHLVAPWDLLEQCYYDNIYSPGYIHCLFLIHFPAMSSQLSTAASGRARYNDVDQRVQQSKEKINGHRLAS